jgi:uncharacterized membrane protein
VQIVRNHAGTPNVHPAERWLSLIGGGALAFYGLSKGRHGIGRTVAGLAIMKRGITGNCEAYQALGIRTAPSGSTIPYELGVRARASVTIAESREKIYQFWRDLQNLPRFMQHLESVEPREDGKYSTWVAKGPADKPVRWEAEMINDIPNELIAWKSLPGSDVSSAGSVSFKDAPGGRGTEIRVELQYNPPGGVIGAYVAKLFGREPEQEIRGDLARLKQYMESGEIATTAGQPAGELPKEGRTTGQMLREAIA